MFNIFKPFSNQPRDGDAAVIAQLEGAGSDITQTHKIDFALIFPSQEKTKAACEEIIKIYPEFKTRVDVAGNNSEWLLEVYAEIVPTLPTMHKIGEDFKQIASNFQGDYDGWGAQVVK